MLSATYESATVIKVGFLGQHCYILKNARNGEHNINVKLMSSRVEVLQFKQQFCHSLAV